jgi:hypothetical protein
MIAEETGGFVKAAAFCSVNAANGVRGMREHRVADVDVDDCDAAAAYGFQYALGIASDIFSGDFDGH